MKEGKTKSFDDSMTLEVPGGRLKPSSSETHLDQNLLSIPTPKGRTGSKLSLLDKFADMSKAINEKQRGKRSRSPFGGLFKKSKSREASPASSFRDKRSLSVDRVSTLPPKFTRTASADYSDSDMSGPVISVTGPGAPPGFDMGGKKKQLSHGFSEGSFASEEFQSEAEQAEMDALADLIDEYYYGVRIFPGKGKHELMP